ncbi:MAG: PTS system mannose/fructose/sorbose family transporter subunit IID [Lactobacillus sp.]|jgi:PTS system mannose-specific IID component|uniref:PTS system mannose/fructose/sorbose family transporter subunit IID n=1 Tax=Lacticaseibacillus suilingensis TaxID=2799577 RepID=A0ABW4BF45_9LACO|nr:MULTISPECIES: PTS system mannose/fructose/sorbose family transporter subunit IID [Lacticaseibacillus]MCI1894370.1 PTS system mannose/fructose/sorbose family transporter subunit IID [Lactobacillus sp.]MCI1917285.1 PTS system mannose/fructose/sorbose family transporter subunit IID [Lactobacillus sp.]MCI1941068.1 PTS system mannose/fructose/sorbose family transporter subunit IID [Lactobacillus sp.]MCI1971611.1 PTS system mannose/fructose/sorbose family transporter subunit IID [Lactobacillus sp.
MTKIEMTAQDKKLTKRMFWRNMFLGFNMSYTRQQGVAWDWVHAPIYREIYKDDDQFWEAMKRNMEFYNITPNMNGMVSGLALSMEEENAKAPKGTFDTAGISGMKIGLMGPMAGIGDTFFSGVWALIIMGIAISFAKQGNLIVAALPLIALIPNLLVRYYGQKFGYKLGTKYIQKAVENGVMAMFTKAASIVGVTVVGGMIATLVKVPVIFKTKINGTVFELQKVLDQILPNMLPLLLAVGCFVLLRKNVSPVKVLLGVVVLGFALTFLGITGA